MSARTYSYYDDGITTYAAFDDGVTEYVDLLGAGAQVIFNDDLDSPGFDISFAVLDLFTSYSVIRRSVNGEFPDMYVRGGENIEVTADTLAQLGDYEAPFGVELVYVIQRNGPAPTEEISDPVTLTVASSAGYYDDAYLKSVHTPSLSRRIHVVSFDSYSRSPKVIGRFDVLRRSKPVILTDVLGARSGTFQFFTSSLGGATSPTRREYDQLFERGDTLLFQAVDWESAEIEDIFFKVTSPISYSRKTVVGHTDPVLVIEIGFEEIDRPSTSGEVVSLNGWADVAENFVDWQEVLDNRTDWLDVYNRAQEGP